MAMVSVVIPVYNAQLHLRQCLDTVLGQTLQELEILCVDDGSTDESPRILQEYQEKDARVRVIRQQNAGAGAARNVGLTQATGKYVSFLDADDFFEPDMLEAAYRQAEQYRAEFVVYRSNQYHMDKQEFVDVSWVVRMQDVPPYMPFSYRQLSDNVFKTFVGWAWDKLYLRSFVLEHQLMFQEQRTSNDMLFVFSALVVAKRIAIVDKILAHQRRGGNGTLSVTREKSWHCFYDALTALRKRLQDEDVFWELEKDFVNYALHFSLWNLNTLKAPTYQELKENLCREWFTELGINERPETFFYNRREYEQYWKLINGD